MTSGEIDVIRSFFRRSASFLGVFQEFPAQRIQYIKNKKYKQTTGGFFQQKKDGNAVFS